MRSPPVTDIFEKNATFDMYFFFTFSGWYISVASITNPIITATHTLAVCLIWSDRSEYIIRIGQTNSIIITKAIDTCGSGHFGIKSSKLCLVDAK